MQPENSEKPINKPVLIGATLWLYYYALKAFVDLWTLDSSGISTLNHKLPEWDFTNLWAGGMLARAGHLTTLFDVPQYRHFMSGYFHATLSHMEWSYPPHLLLLGLPLAHLSLLNAYLLWTVGTWGLLAVLLRRQEFDWPQFATAAFSPGVFYSIFIGQNGCLTGFLLFGCLSLARSRPVLAGALLGILSVKPQFCLMAGIALLAMGNWRAVLAVLVTASSMVALTTWLWGIEVWQLWYNDTLPYMVNLMDESYTLHGTMLAITPFYMLRDLGVQVSSAMAVQGVITIMCAGSTWYLWRREILPQSHRIAVTLLLTLLATPYAQAYDMVGAGIAVALLMNLPGISARITLYALWTLPMAVAALNDHRITLAPLIIAASLILVIRQHITTSHAQ